MVIGWGPPGHPCAENQRCTETRTSAWKAAASASSRWLSREKEPEEPEVSVTVSSPVSPLLAPLVPSSESEDISLFRAPSRGVVGNEPESFHLYVMNTC